MMKMGTNRQVNLQPFPMQTQQITGIKLPKLTKRRKKNFHTKNPFKVKQHLIPDDSAMNIKKLNGFLLLAITKNDMPHEIFRANLSRLRIVECVTEDFKYFINLEDLDISENEVIIEQLTSFPCLKTLRICANNIQQINLSDINTFLHLKKLDLSFNYLDMNAIQSLQIILNLNELCLSNNELEDLPENMENFQNLKKLDLCDNNFSSNNNAQQIWFTLANIPNLINLNISRNFFRGIHTEKLIAGNFIKLEVLDFSYNVVENQHNLICARNFKNLKEIYVTGNPFAILKEHQGIEMEIHARTGGRLINDEIHKPYLRKLKTNLRPPIRFEKLKKVEEDRFRIFDDVTIKEEQEEEEQEEEEKVQELSEPEDNAEQVLFMTEHQDTKGKQVTKQQHSQPLESNKQSNYTYDEFKKLAFEILGESQEYETPVYDLNTAYKTLKNVMNRPDAVDYKNFEEPHYLKPTASIQRYKFVLNEDMSEISSHDQTKNKQNSKLINTSIKEKSQQIKEDDFNFDLQNIYKQ